MSAPEQTRPLRLARQFWESLDRIESHRQRVQSEHETWRRSLDRLRDSRNADLQLAWQRYCEVIAQLEDTTAELEALRVNLQSPGLSEGDHEAAFPFRVR
jgi:hypothetical protein